MDSQISENKKEQDYDTKTNKEIFNLNSICLNDLRYGMIWSQILDQPRFRRPFHTGGRK